MLSEFALPKDVVPEFQVWNGKERLGKAEEQRLVNNENMEAKTFKDNVLTFKTPMQDVNKIQEIYSRNYEIKLVARRKSDNACSKPFPFFFFKHNEIPISDINGCSHACLYCSIYTNEEMPSIKPAIPGEKKRKIPSSAEKKKTPKSRRVSDALSNGSGLLSPDSAIGGSPSHDSSENLIEMHQTLENGFSHSSPVGGTGARVEEILEESQNHVVLENGVSSEAPGENGINSETSQGNGISSVEPEQNGMCMEVTENTKEMLVDGSKVEESNSEEFTGADDIIAEIIDKEVKEPGIVEEKILNPEILERLLPDELLEDPSQQIETDQAKTRNEVKERTKKPKSSRPSGKVETKGRKVSSDIVHKGEHPAKPEQIQTATSLKQSILHDYADILTDTKKSLFTRLVLVFLLLLLQLAAHRTEERHLSKLFFKLREVYWTFPIILVILLITISNLGSLDNSFADSVEGGGLFLGMLASSAAGVLSIAFARNA